MSKRNWLALLSVVLTACAPPPAVKPTLVNIDGYGRWTKATATAPDTFGFSLRPAEDVCPGVAPVNFTTCPPRFPDTAFIDFYIPTGTSFTVSSGGTTLTEVGPTATMSDYQYRRAAMDDGSGKTSKWRIAVAVPSAGRTWCPATLLPLNIVDVSATQPSPSAPLPVTLWWGQCAPPPGPYLWYSTGGTATPGTPTANSPPAPVPDCPNGGFSKAFNVCERCGTSGIPIEKTFWGCSLADAQAKMGGPGCTSTLRPGINC
jgi:hypothetical protein